jgi:FdhD protein
MKSLHETYIIRTKGDLVEETSDDVAAEIGFTLKVNDKEVVTLLCSPAELDAMAVGFLLSEGILKDRESLIDVQVNKKTFTVSVSLKNLPDDIDETFHTKTVTSGCGRGITFTDAANLKYLESNRSPVRISLVEVQNLLKEFRSISELFIKTGGVHSAALADTKQIHLFAEDIGRHNAVDKLIGKAFLAGIQVEDRILLTSGRISGEIMTKIIRNRTP